MTTEATLDTLMSASAHDEAFFQSLPSPVQNATVLWLLGGSVSRGGMPGFLENPKWLREAAAGALADLGWASEAEDVRSIVQARGFERRGVIESSEHRLGRLTHELGAAILARPIPGLEAQGGRASEVVERVRSEAEAKQKRKADRDQAGWAKVRGSAKPYARDEHFPVGAGVVHAKFGLGKVTGHPSKDTIELKFESGETRTLGHRPAG